MNLPEIFGSSELKERLKLEIERSQRYVRPLSLARITLDNLNTLKKASQSLFLEAQSKLTALFKENCRRSDVAGYYGEEEFALILPETDASGAFIVAERMRAKAASKKFKVGTGEIPLTLSAGVASYPIHAASIKDLIKEAEEALEIARSSGDRVSGPPPE